MQSIFLTHIVSYWNTEAIVSFWGKRKLLPRNITYETLTFRVNKTANKTTVFQVPNKKNSK